MRVRAEVGLDRPLVVCVRPRLEICHLFSGQMALVIIYVLLARRKLSCVTNWLVQRRKGLAPFFPYLFDLDLPFFFIILSHHSLVGLVNLARHPFLLNFLDPAFHGLSTA